MVEIIPKPAPKIPLWQEILFYLGIFLLIATIGSYFGLNYLQKRASGEIQTIEDQISKVKTAEEEALKRELFEKEKKIKDFSVLLDEHQIHSNLFPFLGEICHPKVQFLSLGFSKSGEYYQVNFPAQAESYEVLHQQILILRDEELIKDLKLSGISVGKEGKVNFSLVFSLDPSIFEFK